MSPVPKPFLPEERCFLGGRFREELGHGVLSRLSNFNSINFVVVFCFFLNDDTLWKWGWGETDACIHFWKEYKPLMPFSWAIWQYISKALNVCITFYLASLLVRKCLTKVPKNDMHGWGWSLLMMGKTGNHLNVPTGGAGCQGPPLWWETHSHLMGGCDS